MNGSALPRYDKARCGAFVYFLDARAASAVAGAVEVDNLIEGRKLICVGDLDVSNVEGR